MTATTVRVLVIAAVAMAVGISSACSSSSTPAPAASDAGSSGSSGSSGAEPEAGEPIDCPDDVPAACPSPAPTYAKDIAPIMAASCGSAKCHAPGGRESMRPLDDYAGLFAQRDPVLLQVNACRMPPREGPAISAEARKAILAWVVCGAKND